MGSRVRIAAAGLLIAACALLMGGVGDAVAYASPVHDSAGADDGDGARTGSSHRDGTTSLPRASRGGARSAGAESRYGKPQGRTHGDRRTIDRPHDRRPGSRKPSHEKPDPQKPDHDKRDKPDDDKPAGQGAPSHPGSSAGAGSPNDKEPEGDCGQNWPGRPSDPAPDTSPVPPSGGGGVSAPAQPARRPTVPSMHLPSTPRPVTTPQAPVAPVTPPVITEPPVVVPGGGAAQSRPLVPAAPRGAPVDPPANTAAPPRTGTSAGIPPTSFRPGYPDYLRGAGVAEVAALAGPGLAGILILTGLGALVGYRQAKAGHAVRSRRAAKFVN